MRLASANAAFFATHDAHDAVDYAIWGALQVRLPRGRTRGSHRYV